VAGKVSIIVTSFKRAHLLKWGLHSLTKQNIPFAFETLVLNDGIHDATKAICQEYEQKLNIKYIFTGQRNLAGELNWRVPGFAINIGAKLADGDVLIISCAEMFHINDTIARLTYPLLFNNKFIGIPVGIDDQDGFFLNHIANNNGYFKVDMAEQRYTSLNTHLPFLMSISRKEFLAIGGYDEDFVGIGYDDNDLVDRLLNNGCSYYQTDAQTIHLYHERQVWGRNARTRLMQNYQLYIQRQGQIIRNQNREWGKLLF